MDEKSFRNFLKKGGRSPAAVERVIKYLGKYQEFLKDHYGKSVEEAQQADLEAFVESAEQFDDKSVKSYLWAIIYFYKFTSNEEMRVLAGNMRQERIKRTPFLLRNFRGVSAETANRLEKAGIRDVQQMLKAGRTDEERQVLARKTGLAEEVILELVKLSDLARIPGIKGIRSRLYHDAGIDCIEKLAACQPEELLELTASFVEKTGFDGIAPLPKEVRSGIAKARKLKKVVTF
ncbi:DUF4332 domain-containing protein [Chloroflexota bacterium]